MMNRRVRITLFSLLAILTCWAGDFVYTPIDVSHGLSDNQIRYILQLPDGRMVFTTSGNLNLYDGVYFKYIHRTSRHIYPLRGYNGFYRIYQSKDSLLWIKDTHKLMCVDLVREQYIPDLNRFFTNRGIKYPVEDIFIDSEQRLWLLHSGILSIDGSDYEININKHSVQLQDLDADKHHLYLFYDSGEIVCYNLKTKNKIFSKTAYSDKESSFFRNTSLVVNEANGFYQLKNGSKGGFFFFNTKTQAWTKLLETGYTLNTLVIKENIAYISCPSGFWVIDLLNHKKEYRPTLKMVDGKTIETEISTLFYDRQGGFWLGTINQGLLYYHPSRYKFSYIGAAYFSDKQHIKNLIVYSFAEDKAGNIYIKSNFGIYKYSTSESDKRLLNISQNILPEDILNKLNRSADNTFLYDSRDWKWEGTADGLKLDRPGKKEEIFYTENGLSNNFIHGILEDRSHSVWITTSYGISKAEINMSNGKIHFLKFNSFDGTLDGEYTDGAVMESSDGLLYFGGINGFNILNPRQISYAELPFRPVFTNFFLHGEKIEAGKSYSHHVILSSTPPYTKEIDLSYNQNFLTFEFSGINYQNPSQTYYRYQLEGVDSDWREIVKDAYNKSSDGILRISYTNLPHGKYTLKVMASSNNHQWKGDVTQLKITIHPPWWKTGIAYTLYAALFVIGTFSFIYLYIRISRKRIERQHKEDMLLLRIRNLIEQCNILEAEKESNDTKNTSEEILPESNKNPSTADNKFLSRAIELVEKNLDEPNYSVETLSRDLCMDRTGLYRKLIALLDKSPSLFIRNIRLQKAAQLILEEELSIAEIADKVGFSSGSYLSKCFQEMYGCRPSEYAEKTRKTT